MAPRSMQSRSAATARKNPVRSKSDLCNGGHKQGIRDMMAKVTGSCVIEMTFFGQDHEVGTNGDNWPNLCRNSDISSEPQARKNLEYNNLLYQTKRFPVLGPTRQDTELFSSSSKTRSGPVRENSAGERTREQSCPSPNWQDQATSRAPSRATTHATSVPDVTRIDIYPDSNGNPATRCSEHFKSSSTFNLTAKPPRSTFTRSVDHDSRNSSAHRKANRSGISSSSQLNPSRSADAAKGRKEQVDGYISSNKNGDSGKCLENGGNEEEVNDGEGDGGSGVYCVIRSGATPRSRTRKQVTGALTKHQFRQVCSRPHQAVVFTADTASLLLRSGPPLLIRPAADISLHRQSARSAIQRVTAVNYITELHGIPRSKSGVETSSRGQEQYRGRLALGRNSSSIGGKVKQLHKDTLSRENTAPTNVLQRAASDEIVCRTSSAGLKEKQLDTHQAAYISRDSSVASRHNQSFTGQAHARSEPSTSATSLNMANRQKLKKSTLQAHKKSKPTQQVEAEADGQKTLIPSKHGFHPRSHSPTFKRLVAASERLQEVQPGAYDSSVKASSVSNNPVESIFYGSSSSDSLRDMRTTLSQDQVNGILKADYDSNNNNIGKAKHIEKDINSSNSSYLKERNGRTKQRQNSHPAQQPPLPAASTENRRGRGEIRTSRLIQNKGQNLPMRQRHERSFDRQHRHKAVAEDNTSCPFPDEPNIKNRESQDRPKRSSRLPDPEDGDRVPPSTSPLPGHYGVEMEARVREGQPTQLHFFLPQLADGMSDGSGGNLTGRSNYRERRLELLDWRDARGSGSDGGFHHGSSVVGPGGALHCDKDEDDPTSFTTISEIQTHGRSNTKSKQYQKDIASNRTNGYRGGSKERITAYDLKNGHLTINRGRQLPQARDESVGLSQPHKHKRHVSPLRAQKVAEKPVRNRRASNSPYRAPLYLESQLPSEKLKKQIDDFPTLVSMDYSDTDTSLQVR